MHGNRKYRDGYSCLSCGNMFVPVRPNPNTKTLVYDGTIKRRFCSPNCHDGRRVNAWPGSTCKNCSIQFTKINWPKHKEPFAIPVKAVNCSRECFVEAARQAGLEQAKSFPGAPVYTCKNCGAEFQRVRHGTDPVFCSRKCHQHAFGNRFTVQASLRKDRGYYRMRVCYGGKQIMERNYKSRDLADINCDILREEIKRLFPEYSPSNPHGSHRRKRLEHALRAYELPSKRRYLRERDGDACHICGDPINFEAPATHPDSCTVDHVIPIAAGGDSRIDNLKLAHWHCNCIVKNDKIFDETQKNDYIRPHD